MDTIPKRPKRKRIVLSERAVPIPIQVLPDKADNKPTYREAMMATEDTTGQYHNDLYSQLIKNTPNMNYDK